MQPATLRTIAAQIATVSPGSDEESAIWSAAHSLAYRHMTTQALTGFNNPWVRGHHESAAAAFIETFLPEHGYTFGKPPARDGASPRALAQIWLSSDRASRVYEAATPALALLRGALVEMAMNIEAQRLRDCEYCHGAGRYPTASGMQHCTAHLQAAE